MKKYFALILMSIPGIILARSENQLLSLAVGKSMECVSQATDQFSMETCQEMLRSGNDNSLAKYDECKCVGACVAKRMQLMREKGEYDMEKLKKYFASMDSEAWTKEANVVMDKCKNIKNIGNDCDYVFQWMSCALSHSKMADQVFKSFMGGGGAPKTESKKTK